MKNTQHFSIIAAICKKNRGIGINGKLPWKNTTDMKYFQGTTTNCVDLFKMNAVIMGRNTLESLKKLLPNRLNICITSRIIDMEKLFCFKTLDEALSFLNTRDDIEKIFVIGGETLYKTALEHPECQEILINEIDNDVICDTFFPEIDVTNFQLKNKSHLFTDVLNLRYIRNKQLCQTIYYYN